MKTLTLVLLLVPVLAFADRYRLPEGSRLKTPQGTYQGYTLEEMKILLKMDNDLRSFTEQLAKYPKIIEDQTKLSSNLRSQMDSKDKQIQILQDERVRLTEKWTKENKLRHLAENKVSWTTWLAWGAAGTMGAIATGLAVGLIIERNR